MAYNFPNNPVLGEQYSSSGRTFEWDGVKWNVVSSSISAEGRPAYATVSSTPPVNPQQGRLWYDTVSSCLKIRTGSEWKLVIEFEAEVFSKVRISSSPPLDPNIGDLWFDPENSFLSIWYEDTDSVQWVTIVPYVESGGGSGGGGSGDPVQTTTIVGPGLTTIDLFDKDLFRSARIHIQVSQAGKYQSTDLIVLHDGTSVFLTEYGTVTSSGLLASFDAFLSGTSLLIQAKLEVVAEAVVKSIMQKIPV